MAAPIDRAWGSTSENNPSADVMTSAKWCDQQRSRTRE